MTSKSTTVPSGTLVFTASAITTVKVASTVVQTSFTTTPCAQPTQTFAIQLAGDPRFQGYYLKENLGNANLGNYVLSPQPDLSQASKFYISSSNLHDTQGRVFIDGGGSGQQVALKTAGTAVSACTISNNRLSCVSGARNSFWIHDYGNNPLFKILIWGESDIRDTFPDSGDGPFLTLNVVPLCRL